MWARGPLTRRAFQPIDLSQQPDHQETLRRGRGPVVRYRTDNSCGIVYKNKRQNLPTSLSEKLG
jgi:hypothetical protein